MRSSVSTRRMRTRRPVKTLRIRHFIDAHVNVGLAIEPVLPKWTVYEYVE
jgi:hypothetical protein